MSHETFTRYEPTFRINWKSLPRERQPGGRLLRRSRMKKKAAKWKRMWWDLASVAKDRVNRQLEEEVAALCTLASDFKGATTANASPIDRFILAQYERFSAFKSAPMRFIINSTF